MNGNQTADMASKHLLLPSDGWRRQSGMRHFHFHLVLQCLILSLIGLCLCCSMCKVDGFSAQTDREALLSFKRSVSDPENFISGWGQNESHCSWNGVTCSLKGARVRSLNLSRKGLVGAIPQQLSNLTSLYVLDLSSNSFYNQIPPELGRLSHLQYLDLRNNSIQGSIPAGLSQCQSLKLIYLANNKLTGKIPEELGHLQSLEVLDFSINGLTGAIPTTFSNLTSLTGVFIARNQLDRIPGELGRLPSLQTIQLSENKLSGDIPHAIFNISSLTFLSLTNNNLTGKLPRDLGYNVPNLVSLYLAQNKLEGPLPNSLANASTIQHLDLSYNEFQGPIPSFGKLNNLVDLNLGQNHLSSTTMENFQLIESLNNCTQLEVLRIFSNQLSGQFPRSVANLSTHLQDFCFSDNFLTGTFPQGMEKFHNLTVLSMELNSFTGEVPNSTSTLKKLTSFLVYGNMLSGEIPDIFGNFTQLTYLRLENNRFSGRIPPSISLCQRLNTLALSANRLEGNIPEEIFGLSTLVWLTLGQNELTGPLPENIGNLKQLQFLDVSDNQLSGNISASIGGCSSLLVLIMAENNFTGSIPSAIGRLTSLEKLDLSSNSLTGVIPEELEKLRYLQKLNLSFNLLEGEVPASSMFMNFSHESLQGNTGLCSSNREAAEKLGLNRCSGRRRKRHQLYKVIVPVAVSTSFIAVVFCFICAFILRKQHKTKDQENFPYSLKGLPPRLSYFGIRQATDNFSAENILGKGGFGSVYKGTLSSVVNGSEIDTPIALAIKVLDLEQSKAARSFEAECEALKIVRHRNLVKVITSCSTVDHKGDEFKALVMEFMPQGNLDKWLHQNDAEPGLCLSLLQRLNIAIDIASAVDYLHNDCDPPIVHRDLKPGNVLLDDDMVAHVGDFGLARLLSENASVNDSSTNGLKGTIGYIAPEYGMGSKASTCGDVYSFGILLLEIFTGKKPADEMFKESLSLKKFASAVNENRVLEIADPRLFKGDGHSTESSSNGQSIGAISSSSSSSSNYSNHSGDSKVDVLVAAVIRLGLSCAAHSAKDRLTMKEALAKLQEIRKTLLEM